MVLELNATATRKLLFAVCLPTKRRRRKKAGRRERHRHIAARPRGIGLIGVVLHVVWYI